MAPTYDLPIPDDVSKKLSDMLGKPAKASPGNRFPVGPKTPGAVSILVNEENKPGAVIFADVAFACSAGGALSMIPQNIVEEGIKSGDIPANMLDSFREVMNVAQSWFEKPDAPKLKLESVRSAIGNCSRALLTMLLKSKNRLDLSVEFTGYPKGRIVICVT
jgi:hypothetical protein